MSFLLYTSFLNSISITLLITVNQFISVKYAIKYNTIVTANRLYVAIATVVTLSSGLHFTTFMLNSVVYMFAAYLGFVFVVMTILMCFIFLIARAAIKTIMNSKMETNESNATFVPQKMKKLFSEPNNMEAERLKKEKEMKTNQRLACISGIPVTLIGAIACMCVQSITSSLKYSDVKGFIILGSLYVMLNPVIYVTTMSEIRFFVKKDFFDWKDSNAITLSLLQRRRRRTRQVGSSE